jgi:hypothetical protein
MRFFFSFSGFGLHTHFGSDRINALQEMLIE